MAKYQVLPAKYVFLDVVGYTTRSVEAQSIIIAALNTIVRDAVASSATQSSARDGSIIYIPVGDGICIALLGGRQPYDIHINIANEIVRRLVGLHNKREPHKAHRFEVRIGINEKSDNVVRDINRRRNVAGGGINNAQRIMSVADGNQILVSRAVYDNLRDHAAYRKSFREYEAEVKHGDVLQVYQLVKADYDGLNVGQPSRLASTSLPSDKIAAFYSTRRSMNDSYGGIQKEMDNADEIHAAWHAATVAAALSTEKQRKKVKRLLLLHPCNADIDRYTDATIAISKLQSDIIHATRTFGAAGVEVRWFDGPFNLMTILDPGDADQARARVETWMFTDSDNWQNYLVYARDNPEAYATIVSTFDAMWDHPTWTRKPPADLENFKMSLSKAARTRTSASQRGHPIG